MAKQAYHGEAFFDAVESDFAHLEKSSEVINADVLDAWFDPSPGVLKKLSEFLPYALRTSPPTHNEGLVATLSNARSISTEQIVTAGGSSDIMFLLFPNLLCQGDTVMILDPMYGKYQHIFENVVDVNLVRHTLSSTNDFKVDVDKLAEDIRAKNPRLVVIVNPNSPTGQYVDKQEMLRLLDAIPQDTLLVIDETYIEYVGSENSLEQSVKDHPNLAIIKSMSKVYALSGARIGYLVGNASLIEKVSQFVPPWSVSLVGQIAAVEALKDPSYYADRYRETHELREEFMALFSDLKTIKVYPSVANYFLVELKEQNPDAEAIVTKLRESNIFIRNCDSMSTQFRNNFLRIAVRDRTSNAKVSDALRVLLQ